MIGQLPAKRSGKEIKARRRKVRNPQIGVVVPFGMNRVAGSPQFIVRIKKIVANSGKFGAHVQRATCNWLP